jgi:hypothetical protein
MEDLLANLVPGFYLTTKKTKGTKRRRETPVILNEAKDLAYPMSFQILRSTQE